MSSSKTKSEEVFEGFLSRHQLPFDPTPVARSPRPNYLVTCGPIKIVFEVKELSEDQEYSPAKGYFNMPKHISRQSADPRNPSAPNSARRRFLKMGLLGVAGSLFNPGWNQFGSFTLIKPAEAAWLQVAMLAVSAFSAFSKGGDGGIGAYLANIKSLSEENIHLTKQVLVGIGQIQAQIEELPGRLREVFLEVKGYELKQGAQEVLDKLLFIEAQYKAGGRIGAAERRDCQSIIDRCTALAGARSVPFGRGGTAAACAPLIGAVEARAWWFLHRAEDFRHRVNIAYLPWFDEMLVDQDGSVMRALREEAAKLTAAGDNGLNSLPSELREAMSSIWKEALGMEPGKTTGEVQLTCGSYARHTGDRRECRDYDCIGPDILSLGRDVERVLKLHELTPAQVRELQRAPNATGLQPAARGGRCFCSASAWEVTPLYTREGGGALRGRLVSEQAPNLPPRLRFEHNWLALQDAGGCSDAAKGRDTDRNQQFAAVRDSGVAAQIGRQLSDWQTQALAGYNDQRAVIFTTYMLMDAARGAREQFRQVVR